MEDGGLGRTKVFRQAFDLLIFRLHGALGGRKGLLEPCLMLFLDLVHIVHRELGEAALHFRTEDTLRRTRFRAFVETAGGRSSGLHRGRSRAGSRRAGGLRSREGLIIAQRGAWDRCQGARRCAMEQGGRGGGSRLGRRGRGPEEARWGDRHHRRGKGGVDGEVRPRCVRFGVLCACMVWCFTAGSGLRSNAAGPGPEDGPAPYFASCACGSVSHQQRQTQCVRISKHDERTDSHVSPVEAPRG